MANKQDDYGYFGKGIDGYVHYKQAFDRNFPQNSHPSQSSTQQHSNHVNSAPSQSNTHQDVTDVFSGKDAPTKLDDSMMHSDSFYYPPAQQQHSQYNPPSKGESDKNSSRSAFCTFIMFILMWMGVMTLIMGIPYLLGFLISGSSSGADSFGGIFILIVGVILIVLL